MKRLFLISLVIAAALFVFLGAAKSTKQAADSRNAALAEICE